MGHGGRRRKGPKGGVTEGASCDANLRMGWGHTRCRFTWGDGHAAKGWERDQCDASVVGLG